MFNSVLPKELEEIELAKEKISAGDYLGARRMLLQVKRNFPAFDNISGMIAVCDILISAGLGFMDIDFYAVLQIPPEATTCDLISKLNKFTALLEPIASNFPGAASALRIVHDAFSALFHQERRKMFDIARARKLHDSNSLATSSIDATNVMKSCEKKPSSLKDSHQDYHNFDNTRKAELLSVDQVWATYDEEGMPRRYAQIICIDELPFRLHVSWFKPVPVTAHERKWCEVKMPVVCGLFSLDENERTVIEPTLLSHMIYNRNVSEQIEIYPQTGEVWAVYKDWRPLEWISNPEARKECTLEIVEIIDGYFNLADVVVKRLVKAPGTSNVFGTSTKNENDNGRDRSFAIPAKSMYKFSHKIPAYRISDEMFELDHLAVPSVPEPSDADAKSLKRKWSVKDFTPQQVWAIYDGQDLMPRTYVVVNNVISWSKVGATLLEPCSVLDEETSSSSSSAEDNVPFASGLFRCGETSLNLDLFQFSHTIKCDKIIMEECLYRIYPKKGEVWAMYKHWDGTTRKRGDVNRQQYDQYEIVEIVKDSSDESGLTAAILMEVPGWKSFFRRQQVNGCDEVYQMVATKEILCRFSHQIPAYTVEGIEVHGIPKGSWHLEPDSLPPRLSR